MRYPSTICQCAAGLTTITKTVQKDDWSWSIYSREYFGFKVDY